MLTFFNSYMARGNLTEDTVFWAGLVSTLERVQTHNIFPGWIMSIPLACDINTFKMVQLNKITMVYLAFPQSLRVTLLYTKSWVCWTV